MVLVNGKKFACESCIKGHRSSSCKHNDRPLFEVKKKGRPVSQCQQCRDLRKERKIHSKCLCETKPEKPQVRQLTATARRYIALHPTLPNGLKDVINYQDESLMSTPRAGVDKLLNPCNCKDIWTCKCRSASTPNNGTVSTSGGLGILADAASLRIYDETTSAPTADYAGPTITVQPSRSCCQSSNSQNTSSKRKDRGTPSPTPPPSAKHRGPFLPPIQTPSATASISTPLPTPEFPTIPPLSSIAALAGSGCTCGFRCTCPGCVEHRGPQHASQEHGDCTDGNCSTCIDHDGGVELPTVQSHHSSHASSCCESSGSPKFALNPMSTSGISFVDSFFARRPSVLLPPAPPQRARRGTLTFDPTDTTVYPSILFTGGPKHMVERGPAFGLVNVPKLRCCAGRCGCPDGSCGCDHGCGGCCNESEATTP